MRYGNQLVQTAVVTDRQRLHAQKDVLALIEQFHQRLRRTVRRRQPVARGRRADQHDPRVLVRRAADRASSRQLDVSDTPRPPPEPASRRACHYVGVRGGARHAGLRRKRARRRHGHRRDRPSSRPAPPPTSSSPAGRTTPPRRAGCGSFASNATDKPMNEATAAEDQALRRQVPRRQHAVPRAGPGDHAIPPHDRAVADGGSRAREGHRPAPGAPRARADHRRRCTRPSR